MIGNFNEEAQTILNNAKKEMIGLGHPYIGTEHLLLAILNSDSNICDRLSEYGLEYDNFKSELCKVVGTTDKKNEVFLYTPLLRKVIQNAKQGFLIVIWMHSRVFRMENVNKKGERYADNYN